MLEFRSDCGWHSISQSFNSLFRFLFTWRENDSYWSVKRGGKKGFCGSRAHFLIMLLKPKMCLFKGQYCCHCLNESPSSHFFRSYGIVCLTIPFSKCRIDLCLFFKTWNVLFYFLLPREMMKCIDALKSAKLLSRIFFIHLYTSFQRRLYSFV